jgi:hypothetical protein
MSAGYEMRPRDYATWGALGGLLCGYFVWGQSWDPLWARLVVGGLAGLSVGMWGAVIVAALWNMARGLWSVKT